MTVCPAKTRISLGIHPVWSESSLSAWRKLGSLAIHWAHSEDSDQTGRMPRLIWVFAGCTCHFVGFVTRRLIYWFDCYSCDSDFSRFVFVLYDLCPLFLRKDLASARAVNLFDIFLTKPFYTYLKELSTVMTIVLRLKFNLLSLKKIFGQSVKKLLMSWPSPFGVSLAINFVWSWNKCIAIILKLPLSPGFLFCLK